MEPLRFTPWTGSPGLIETINLTPVPVNAVLAAVAGSAAFSGVASVASGSGVSAALAAVAQSATFSGACTVATGGGGINVVDGGVQVVDGANNIEDNA